MYKSKHIIAAVAAYILVRLFSFYFPPFSPTSSASILNSFFSIGYTLLAVFFIAKKDVRGWYLVVFEMVLGGAGNFFAFAGISLRTWLFVASIGVYSISKILDRTFIARIRKNQSETVLIFLLVFSAAFSAAIGYWHGHELRAIIGDFIPYLFLLYYFPLRELLESDSFKATALQVLAGAIIGNALFMAATLFGFSSGAFQLQDGFYHWFRDVANGKVTDLGLHFYRIVLNEHVLLVPIFISYTHAILYLGTNKKINYALSVLLLFILAVNLTRIYIVGLCLALLLLFSKQRIKRWILACLFILVGFFVIFTLTHTIVSRGKSFGWELFGIRLQSIIAPKTEDSSLSRLLLLPKIIEKIRLNPVLGSGIGDAVTVYSPVEKRTISTRQFDWGYLEIYDEMGLFGFGVWLTLMGYTLWQLYTTKKTGFEIPSLAALGATNITSPALFHLLGIIFIVVVLSLRPKPNPEVRV